MRLNSCLMFFAACHLWDDLIDKDKDRSDDDINGAFWIILVDIPLNGYYQRNCNLIMPVMQVAILEWLAANKLEKGKRQDISYTLRCSIVSLIHQASLLCGGAEWADEVGEEIRMKTQSETIDQYMEDL